VPVTSRLLDALLDAVPAHATRVVVVGEDADALAQSLTARDRRRMVVPVDVGHDDPPVDPGSIDAIVYADALSRLRDPLATIERHRPLLVRSGTVVGAFANVQHHSVVASLLRGSLPYRRGSLIDPSSVRLFTATSAVDLFLDAGLAPEVVARIDEPGAEAFVSAAAPLLEHLGVGTPDARRSMSATHVVVRGDLLRDDGADVAADAGADDLVVSFVVCVNDDAQLEANLLRSPDIAETDRHEVLEFRDCATAADGLNAGIERARGDLVVLVHQDVYLPKGWVRRLVAQWRRAQRAGTTVGLAGVFGVADRRVPFDAIGHVVHRERLLAHGTLPADVDGLDELLMVVPRGTGLRADPALGWHLYGTDLALQAHQADQRVVVLDALCHHNSLTGRVPVGYRGSERVLAQKWRATLPIHTNLSSIGEWLLDASGPEPSSDDHADATEGAGATGNDGVPEAVTALVERLRAERGALSAELEQTRHRLASMQASPFWRARELLVRLLRRRPR